MIVTDYKRRQFVEGRDYWYQYLSINGYASKPNDDGLRKLSRNIDIAVPHLSECIHIFLTH